MNVIKRKVECVCSLENIPSSIDVDVSKLHIGSKVRKNDITLPEGVIKTVNKTNFDICSITGRGKSTDTPTEGGENAEAKTEAKK